MSGVRIRIEHGQDAGRTYRFAKPGTYVLGRHPSAALRLLDMKVSKGHCHIRVGERNGSAELADLGSTHGTLLNGNPVPARTATPINPGDEIRLGMTILRVLSDGPADAEATPTPDASLTLAEDLAATAAMRRPAKKGAEAPKKTLPPDELVGKELGGYKVLEKIGQGGMGAVYIAEQKSLNRKVALKVLSERLVKDAAFVDQFVNEARAAGQLNHPNVVQVYDVGQEHGRYFFSMEFVSGGSLEDRIRSKGPVDWREALPWLLDSANAFIFAQRRGILHRDVKPDNLMIAEDGSAKLCDLGLAKKSESQDLLSQGIIGTPHFISPEAIRRKKDIDGRSDLYSLGCAFYRVLTGENPYGGNGKSVKDILMSHLKDPVPRVSAKNPDVPRDLDEVIYRLMQKEPVQRYANAEELFHALDRLRIQYGLEAHGLSAGSKKPLVIAIVAVLAALGVAGYFVLKPEPPPKEAELTEAQRIELQQAADAVARQKQDAFEKFVLLKKSSLQGIELRESRQDLVETWDAPVWDVIVDDYGTFARALATHEEYGKDEQVQDLAKRARDAADRISATRKAFQGIKELHAAAKTRTLGELDTTLQGRRTDFDKALAEKRWLDAETLATPESLESLLKPFRERKIREILPPDIPAETRNSLENQRLVTDEAIDGVVKRVLGDPPMKDWLATLEQRAKQDHQERLKALNETAKTDVAAAVAAADDHLGELPPDDPKPTEGTVRFLLQSFRNEVAALRGGWEERREDERRKTFQADRELYVPLLAALRRPEVGLLWTHKLVDAGLRAAKVAGEMKTPEYRDAAAERQEDVKAVQALFQHFAEAFEKGALSSDKVVLPKEFGGDPAKPVKLKGVAPEGILAPDLVTYASLGLPWVVESGFYADDKTRFELAPEDHRGLAVLAETAGRFEIALRHYQKYLAALPAESERSQNAVRRWLGSHDAEKAAAATWFEAVAIWRRWQEFCDAHDPALGVAFTEDVRADLAQSEKSWNADMTRAQGLLHALETDPRLVGTVWATVLRPAAHPDARFVPNEPAPKAPPAEPRKGPEKREGDGSGKAGTDDASPKKEGDDGNPAVKDGETPPKGPGGSGEGPAPDRPGDPVPPKPEPDPKPPEK